MPEVWKVGEPAAVAAFYRLTAMKPRQVMLSASSKPTTGVRKPVLPLTTEQRKLLLQAICQFLELNDFSKTLKKLLSEADIEKDSWKNSSLNLEDMCCQYLVMCDGDDQNIKGREENGGINSIASGEKGKTEKKKKNNLHNQETDVSSYKHSEDKECDKEKLSNVDGDGNVKLKEKRKKKSSNDSSAQMVEENPAEDVAQEGKPSKKLKNEKKKSMSVSESVNEDSEPQQAEPLEEVKEDIKRYTEVGNASKSKSGKKKKLSSLAEVIDVQGESKTESGHMGQEKQQEGSGGAENGIEKEKKSSKKRKRKSSENDRNNNAEDFKHSNTGLTSEQRASGSEKKDSLAYSQTPSTVGNDSEGLSQNERDKSATQKSSKRQKSEPRAQNAFQRVKADEVVFVDERLQDNSYWAKDGAEVGYGAKAQEVLGQVRGRDFRHEKTKKKRGSYRGGQIDLQSHSIKFNYSDED